MALAERETFERVIEARNRAAANEGSPEDQARDENALVGGLKQLFAVAEGYPELKASRNFLALQEELTSTENKIGFARQAYNDGVMSYNIFREQFPNNILAGLCAFKETAQLELETPEARQAPKVAF